MSMKWFQLTCFNLCYVYEVVLGGWSQHLPIMAETQCSHWPVQPETQDNQTQCMYTLQKHECQVIQIRIIVWVLNGLLGLADDGDEGYAPSVHMDCFQCRLTNLEKQRTQTSSSTVHRLTRASALPVAKYFPVGSNLMQMQLEGWALIDWMGFSSG